MTHSCSSSSSPRSGTWLAGYASRALASGLPRCCSPAWRSGWRIRSSRCLAPLWTLGLVLFVYTVGLAAGPGFVAAFRRRGVGANALVLAAVVSCRGHGCDHRSRRRARPRGDRRCVRRGPHEYPGARGIAGGAARHRAGADLDAAAGRVLVGYSLGYPVGVTVALLAVFAVVRLRGRAEPVVAPTAIVVRTALVQHAGLGTLEQVRERTHDTVAFGRVKRGSSLFVASDDIEPRPGDLVTVVGPENAVEAAIALLGSASSERVELDRADVDFRRIVVSSRAVAGRTIADVDLQGKLGGTVTRVRRGDVDMVASPDLVLELGDHVRVVAAPGRMQAIATFFGDSYRELRELDVLSFSVGIALGLLLGSVDVPLAGGRHIQPRLCRWAARRWPRARRDRPYGADRLAAATRRERHAATAGHGALPRRDRRERRRGVRRHGRQRRGDRSRRGSRGRRRGCGVRDGRPRCGAAPPSG